MSEVTPHLAPIVVMLFLGCVLLVGASALTFIYGVLCHSKTIVTAGAGSALLIPLGYVLLMTGVSLLSTEKDLPPGGWKYFCEIDCHIGYSVAGMQTASSLGPELQPLSARGEFVIVSLKAWFDERTISPTRGDGPLAPNPRRVVLVDSNGQQYEESIRAEEFLARSKSEPASLRQPLRPGESFSKDVVFDVPKDTHGLRLLITEDDPESHLLIDHENSPLHKKIYLVIESPRLSPLQSMR